MYIFIKNRFLPGPCFSLRKDSSLSIIIWSRDWSSSGSHSSCYIIPSSSKCNRSSSSCSYSPNSFCMGASSYSSLNSYIGVIYAILKKILVSKEVEIVWEIVLFSWKAGITKKIKLGLVKTYIRIVLKNLTWVWVLLF